MYVHNLAYSEHFVKFWVRVCAREFFFAVCQLVISERGSYLWKQSVHLFCKSVHLMTVHFEICTVKSGALSDN
jgi:hypothetical protein